MMKCKLNDLCFIIKSLRQQNIGLIVTCKEYIGYFSQDELMTINGEKWAAPDTDHYWIIGSSSSSIDTQYGKSKIGYICDSWLKPIDPDGLVKNTETTSWFTQKSSTEKELIL